MRNLRNRYYGPNWPVNVTVEPHSTTNIVEVIEVATAISGFAGTSIAANGSGIR